MGWKQAVSARGKTNDANPASSLECKTSQRDRYLAASGRRQEYRGETDLRSGKGSEARVTEQRAAVKGVHFGVAGPLTASTVHHNECTGNAATATFNKCQPCARRTVSTMCPVRTHARIGCGVEVRLRAVLRGTAGCAHILRAMRSLYFAPKKRAILRRTKRIRV